MAEIVAGLLIANEVAKLMASLISIIVDAWNDSKEKLGIHPGLLELSANSNSKPGNHSSARISTSVQDTSQQVFRHLVHGGFLVYVVEVTRRE